MNIPTYTDNILSYTYIYIHILTHCCTSKALTPHSALAIMCVPLRAFRCLSYAALEHVGVHTDPFRWKRGPALRSNLPSAAARTFSSCE